MHTHTLVITHIHMLKHEMRFRLHLAKPVIFTPYSYYFHCLGCRAVKEGRNESLNKGSN